MFTANTGSSNAQVAELQVVGSSTPVPTSPDLQVALTTNPITVTPTQAISVGATVRNSGTAGSAATTAVVALGGTTVGTANVPALAAGAQSTITVNAGTRATGTYPLTVTVDPTNTVAESNETNNAASGSVVVSSGPEPTAADLQVSLTGTSPASPTPTDVITVTGTARNTGTAGSAATTVALTLNGTAVGTANVGALAAGAQQNVSVSIGTRAAGTYALVATIDPAGSIAESNESNNSATASLVVNTPGGTGEDLAAGRPATASSTEFTFVAGNAVDADPNTYWEGAGGAVPELARGEPGVAVDAPAGGRRRAAGRRLGCPDADVLDRGPRRHRGVDVAEGVGRVRVRARIGQQGDHPGQRLRHATSGSSSPATPARGRAGRRAPGHRRSRRRTRTSRSPR